MDCGGCGGCIHFYTAASTTGETWVTLDLYNDGWKETFTFRDQVRASRRAPLPGNGRRRPWRQDRRLGPKNIKKGWGRAPRGEET